MFMAMPLWSVLVAVAAGGLVVLYVYLRVYIQKRDIHVRIVSLCKSGDAEAASPDAPTRAVDVEHRGKVKTYYCNRQMYHRLHENMTGILTVKGQVIVGLHMDEAKKRFDDSQTV